MTNGNLYIGLCKICFGTDIALKIGSVVYAFEIMDSSKQDKITIWIGGALFVILKGVNGYSNKTATIQ